MWCNKITSYLKSRLVLGYNYTWWVKEEPDNKTCYINEQGISMFEFLIDNRFAWFGGRIFQQVAGIPMEKCAILLDNLFLFPYESVFLLNTRTWMKEAILFNFTYIGILMTFFPYTIQVCFIWFHCYILL